MGSTKTNFKLAMSTGVSLVAMMFAGGASAQQQAQTPAIEEIVVMGSQIRGARITGVVPVSVVGRTQIEALGAVSGEDLYRSLPQAGDVNFTSQTLRGVSPGAARGDVSSISLRSMDPGNTLVLLNGRRITPHATSQNLSGVPSLTYNSNSLPTMGLERLEILRDGAAALYGSDAVAGVVNNVMRDNVEGLTVEAQYGGAEGTNLRQAKFNAVWGTPFMEDRGHVSVFFNYTNDSKLFSRNQDYTATLDQRFQVAGTDFEGVAAFDQRVVGSAWGSFQALNGPGIIRSNGAAVTNASGQFHIQPITNGGCSFVLGNGICIDDGNNAGVADRNLRLDPAQDIEDGITTTPSIERFNVFNMVSYTLSDNVEFFGELGYYTAKTESSVIPIGILSNTPITIAANSYWNPFGPIGSPNRLPGLNIPDAGLPVVLSAYNMVDYGPTTVSVRNEQYRVLGGFRGEVAGWDWESAALFSRAQADDVSNGVTNSLLQRALNRTTRDAYNPFNGGDPANPSFGDTTAGADPTVMAGFANQNTRTGVTSLALADLKLSKPDLFEMPAGSVGVAAGIEARRETYVNDRDPLADYSTPFIDSVTGVQNGSDLVGASPAFDLRGHRNVYSAYAELAVPVVGPDMSIPMVRAIDLQFAGRYENYSDVGSVAKPKVAGSWDVVEGVRLRSSWSQGFRAPAMETLTPTTRPTEQARLDEVKCEADLRAGRIASFSACVQRPPVQQLSSGNPDLKPEESESFSYGAVLQATFLPPEYGDLTITVDRWKIDQKNTVSNFSPENAITLDYLMRVRGSNNPNVVRAAATPEEIAAVAGTGLAPIGRIVAIMNKFENLAPRTIEGYDIGVVYNLDDTSAGDFTVTLNAARMLKFFQSPSPQQQELLDAQAAGEINAAVAIGGAADLVENAGRPKWKGSAALVWNYEGWGAGLTSQYVGKVYQLNVVNAAGEQWEVKDQTTFSIYGEYNFTEGYAADTTVRLGVRNIFDKDPPLASTGYLPNLYQPYARYWYANIRKSF